MKKINYSKPKIYPKIISEKKLSAFSEKQKQEILKKYKRWYIYYYFRDENGKMKKQPSIFLKINQENKDFDNRYIKIHAYRKSLENILKKGYTPNKENEIQENIKYTNKSSLEFALKIKKNSISESSFTDYKSRVGQFISYLDKKGIANGNNAYLQKLSVEKIPKLPISKNK